MFAALTQAIVKWMATPSPRPVLSSAESSAAGTEKVVVPVIPAGISTKQRWEEAVKKEAEKKGSAIKP